MKVKTKKDRRRRISLRQRKKFEGTAERPQTGSLQESGAHIGPGDRRHDRHHGRGRRQVPSSPSRRASRTALGGRMSPGRR